MCHCRWRAHNCTAGQQVARVSGSGLRSHLLSRGRLSFMQPLPPTPFSRVMADRSPRSPEWRCPLHTEPRPSSRSALRVAAGHQGLIPDGLGGFCGRLTHMRSWEGLQLCNPERAERWPWPQPCSPHTRLAEAVPPFCSSLRTKAEHSTRPPREGERHCRLHLRVKE